MEIFLTILILSGAFILVFHIIPKWLSQKPSPEQEYRRGYFCATESILSGKDPLELLNQARNSLTRDSFDRGWKYACLGALNKNNQKR